MIKQTLLFVGITVLAFSCSKSKVNPKIILYAESLQNGAMVNKNDTLTIVWNVESGSSSLSNFIIRNKTNVIFQKKNPQSPYSDSWQYIANQEGQVDLTLFAENEQGLNDSLQLHVLVRP